MPKNSKSNNSKNTIVSIAPAMDNNGKPVKVKDNNLKNFLETYTVGHSINCNASPGIYMQKDVYDNFVAALPSFTTKAGDFAPAQNFVDEVLKTKLSEFMLFFIWVIGTGFDTEENYADRAYIAELIKQNLKIYTDADNLDDVITPVLPKGMEAPKTN